MSESWCPKCHQTGGTHDDDCPHRFCDHDCDCDECPDTGKGEDSPCGTDGD